MSSIPFSLQFLILPIDFFSFSSLSPSSHLISLFVPNLHSILLRLNLILYYLLPSSFSLSSPPSLNHILLLLLLLLISLHCNPPFLSLSRMCISLSHLCLVFILLCLPLFAFSSSLSSLVMVVEWFTLSLIHPGFESPPQGLVRIRNVDDYFILFYYFF